MYCPEEYTKRTSAHFQMKRLHKQKLKKNGVIEAISFESASVFGQTNFFLYFFCSKTFFWQKKDEIIRLFDCVSIYLVICLLIEPK